MSLSLSVLIDKSKFSLAVDWAAVFFAVCSVLSLPYMLVVDSLSDESSVLLPSYWSLVSFSVLTLLSSFLFSLYVSGLKVLIAPEAPYSELVIRKGLMPSCIKFKASALSRCELIFSVIPGDSFTSIETDSVVPTPLFSKFRTFSVIGSIEPLPKSDSSSLLVLSSVVIYSIFLSTFGYLCLLLEETNEESPSFSSLSLSVCPERSLLPTRFDTAVLHPSISEFSNVAFIKSFSSISIVSLFFEVGIFSFSECICLLLSSILLFTWSPCMPRFPFLIYFSLNTSLIFCSTESAAILSRLIIFPCVTPFANISEVSDFK